MRLPYPKDIARCKQSPSRGGIPIGELKEIAISWGLDMQGKRKDQICDELTRLLETFEAPEEIEEEEVLPLVRKAPSPRKKFPKERRRKFLPKMLYDVGTSGVLLAHDYLDKKTGNPVRDVAGWWASEKFDGVRAIWDGTQLVSRNNKPFHPPETFLDWLRASSLSFDGELTLGRQTFQETVSVVRRKTPDERWNKIQYRIFDAPSLDAPYEERVTLYTEEIERLCSNAPETCPLQPVIPIEISDVEMLEERYSDFLRQGAEGMMVRQPESFYEGTRSWTLLKYKPEFDEEARILGYNPGTGKYKGLLGSFRVELVRNPAIQFDLSGMTDEIRTTYAETHPIGTILTFKYSDLTKEGVPRFPRYFRIREEIPSGIAEGFPVREIPEEDIPSEEVQKKPSESRLPYEKDLSQCLKGPAQGGYAMAELKRIASSWGIDVKGKKKAEICAELVALIGALSTPTPGPPISPRRAPPLRPPVEEEIEEIPSEIPSNEYIAELLYLLALQKPRGFQRNAVEKGAAILERFPEPITDIRQLTRRKIPGIGPGILRRVEEILRTGELKELPRSVQETARAKRKLLQISGIGPVKVEELLEQGIRSVVELREQFQAGKVDLNRHQQLGLRYYEDFIERIPYDELERIGDHMQTLAAALDPDIRIEVVGSHRRKKPFSGDIDLLLTHPKNRNYLSEILSAMKEQGWLTDTISEGRTKYMGVYQSNADHPARRIDFLFVPIESYYTALMHTTGSARFNEEIRTYAKKKGYRLSEFALHKGAREIPVSSEEEIFAILGLPYVPPEEREALII